MATISNNSIAEAIYLASKGKGGEEQSLISKHVVGFLARKRLLSKAPDILSSLNKIINTHERKILAKVSSVEPLNEAIKKEITHSLAKRYGSEKVILEEHIDDQLVGGYRVEVNDELFDISIKNRMAKLQTYLTKQA